MPVIIYILRHRICCCHLLTIVRPAISIIVW